MEITSNSWRAYIQKLNQINSKAGELMETWVEKHGLEDRNALIEYTYSLSSHYGEASAAITCQMYDEITMAEGLTLPDAVPSPTASMDEVAKAVNGSLKQSPTGQLLNSVLYRLSKQASADTMLHNAARDGAEFAWVPVGDTCAFCITLASRGWQRATASLLNTHAEHIHAHCDCTFAVRHDKNSKVGGYDPDEYRRMYDNADGKNAREKINSIRRMKYQENKDRINAQKRTVYDENSNARLRIEAASPFKNPETPLTIDTYLQSKHIIEGARYNEYMKTHKFPPSILTMNNDEIQELVDKYHGTGIIRLDKEGNIIPQEMIVDNDKIIGYATNNNNGKKVETTGFKIHYSDKGTHIVPMYQNQKNYWKERRDNNGYDWLLRQKG